MKTTYSKLRDGSWGVRGIDLKEGQSVTVTKRSGETKTETVGKIVWRDASDLCVATIAGKERKSSPGRGYNRQCSCDDECCRPVCRCGSHCVCRGGNVYDC